MTIGKLNRRIEILRFLTARDEYGGSGGEWVVAGRVWAKIEPMSGTEFFRAQQVTAETTTKITVRYNPGLDVTRRIRYGGKLYEIIGIGDEQASHRWTVINCKELVNEELQREAEKGQG
jgi:SPP1 family predicted phage head-tail adaptor